MTNREQQQQLYQLQAALCQTLADPTRLEILDLLGERPRPVKELIEATGQRQAKVSQHLAVLRQRDIVRTQRVGTEIHYSLADDRILDACRVTRQLLLDQLSRHGAFANSFAEVAK